MTDYDYINQLSEKDKDFLDKFTKEYYVASFDKDKKKRLHKSKKAELQSYKSNNSRNQDMTSYLWNYQALESWEDLTDNEVKTKNIEDAVIALIDLKKR